MSVVLELGNGHAVQAPVGPGVRVVGVDIRMGPVVSVVADLERGLPFRQGSVSGVWSSHALEHLSWAGVTGCLRDCVHVLKPGGWFLAYLPDGEYWVMEASRNGCVGAVRDNLFGQQHHPWDFHRSCWGGEELEREMRGVGFVEVSHSQGRAVGELTVFGVRPCE